MEIDEIKELKEKIFRSIEEIEPLREDYLASMVRRAHNITLKCNQELYEIFFGVYELSGIILMMLTEEEKRNPEKIKKIKDIEKTRKEALKRLNELIDDSIEIRSSYLHQNKFQEGYE